MLLTSITEVTGDVTLWKRRNTKNEQTFALNETSDWLFPDVIGTHMTQTMAFLNTETLRKLITLI